MTFYSPENKEVIFHNIDYSKHKTIQGLLRFFYKFKTEAYKNFNAEAICVLLDLERAIRNCGLSNQEMEVLKLYMDGWTQAEIGKKLNGIKQQTVFNYIHRACEKISRYLTDGSR